jgi:hypothetical protein
LAKIAHKILRDLYNTPPCKKINSPPIAKNCKPVVFLFPNLKDILDFDTGA